MGQGMKLTGRRDETPAPTVDGPFFYFNQLVKTDW